MMKVQWWQDGEPMVCDCVRIELANDCGDLLIRFTDEVDGDWLIIDRENFYMAWEV